MSKDEWNNLKKFIEEIENKEVILIFYLNNGESLTVDYANYILHTFGVEININNKTKLLPYGFIISIDYTYNESVEIETNKKIRTY